MNLKKYKLKGVLFTLILGLIMLISGAGILFHVYRTNDPKALYSQGKIYGSPDHTIDEDSILALKVTGIIDFDLRDETGAIYILEHENGYTLLDAYNMEDKTLNLLLDQQDKLADQPVYIRVSGYDAEVSEEFNAAVEGLNEQLAQSGYEGELDTDKLLFLVNSSDVADLKIAGIILAIFGLGLMLYGLFVLSRNNKTLNTIYTAYPELLENPELITEKGYHEDRLRVLIYKQHLISYSHKLMAVDLRQIRSYNTYIHSTTYYGIPTAKNFFINCILTNNRSIKLPIKPYKRETEGRLENIYAQMQRVFQMQQPSNSSDSITL